MIDNLEDAIAHAREVAENWKSQLVNCVSEEGCNKCLECAKDHEQLADWLTELEADRKLLGDIRSIVWDNSLYDGIKIDKLRRLLSVYEENEEEENRR